MSEKLTFDQALSLERELEAISSTSDFCSDWKSKWRSVALAAQSVLAIFYPLGAKVLGVLITITDNFCSSST